MVWANEDGRAAASAVTFEPSACRAWHTHPLGKTLVVTAGCRWVQRQGAPFKEIRPGNVVWLEPNEKHRHGATPATGMTHMDIQEHLYGKVVERLEKVSDEQYRK